MLEDVFGSSLDIWGWWTQDTWKKKENERKEKLQVLFVFLNCAAKIKSNVVTTIACDLF